MITREADYATRAIAYLASKEDEGKQVSTIDLSDDMDIPYRFLRKIIKTLVDEGLVLSKRGKGGGLSLSKKASEINLLDVISAVDPRGLALSYCLKPGNDCVRQCSCKVNAELAELQEIVTGKLSGITFDKLC